MPPINRRHPQTKTRTAPDLERYEEARRLADRKAPWQEKRPAATTPDVTTDGGYVREVL